MVMSAAEESSLFCPGPYEGLLRICLPSILVLLLTELQEWYEFPLYEIIDDFFQPVEVELSLFWFKNCRGKIPTDTVLMCAFFENIRVFEGYPGGQATAPDYNLHREGNVRDLICLAIFFAS